MAVVQQITGDVYVSGDIEIGGDITPAQTRSQLMEAETFVDSVPLTDLRIHDAPQTVLTGTPGTDDLGLKGTAFGTNSMFVSAGDLKAAGATTRYARFRRKMKDTYVSGQAISVVIDCGMLTTISDGTCTVDVEAYLCDGDTTVTGDKCTTAAQSMNSTTFAEKSFTLTPTGVTSTSEWDIRIAIACSDAATATAVEPAIDAIGISQSCKGG